MSWRPEGWKNPYDKYCPNIYEEGADTMLKELKAKGSLMTPEQMKLIVPDRQFPNGWLVFIPEEEVNHAPAA